MSRTVLILSLLVDCAAASLLFYHPAIDESKVTCVYLISGQYGLLPRLLYYTMLVFAVVARRQLWLVAGALGSALTFSGSAAIHAMVLAAADRKYLLDMDCFGIWAIVSTGSLTGRLFFDWSETLRESPARLIFRLWGLLMIAGVICSCITIFRDYPDENACFSWSGVLLSSPIDLNVGKYQFSCSYACFNTTQMLRGSDEIHAVPKKDSIGRHSELFLVSMILTLVFGCLLGVYGLAVVASHKMAQPSAYTSTIIDEHKPSPSWYRYVAPFVWLLIVLMNELLLLWPPGAPSAEQSQAVGQWSPWVATFLALLASMVIELQQRFARSTIPTSPLA